MLATPGTTTLRTNPAADTDSPALPATAGPTWADLLAGVATAGARRAARELGAILTPRGSCGEDEYAYGHHARHGWYRLDGYDNHERIGLGDLPGELEVDTWPSADPRADGSTINELDADADEWAEGEYLRLADLAVSLGEALEFLLAVQALREEDPYQLDGGLYARLTGVDPVGDGDGDGEPEDDEDRLTGR